MFLGLGVRTVNRYFLSTAQGEYSNAVLSLDNLSILVHLTEIHFWSFTRIASDNSLV